MDLSLAVKIIDFNRVSVVHYYLWNAVSMGIL